MARRADRRHGGRAARAGLATAARRCAGWIAHVGAAGLVWSADLVRFAPVLTYRVAPPSWIAVAVYYVAALVVDAVALGGCGWQRGIALARRLAASAASPRAARNLDSRRSADARSPRAATAGCTSRFSTSARATRVHRRFRAARRCSSMPAACRRRPSSTSAIASSRRCSATPASGGSTTSC